MFILNWYREWLELKREYKAPRVCESCETLKISVDSLRQDNHRLLSRLLEQPNIPNEPATDNITPIKPRHTPWKVRQQMLEENDRHKAKLMREAPKPQSSEAKIGVSADTTIDELEQDVLDAERQRQS